ncbi:MAG: hypothetical protein ACI8YI_000658, partial [Paracoccaceae bacterium]
GTVIEWKKARMAAKSGFWMLRAGHSSENSSNNPHFGDEYTCGNALCSAIYGPTKPN